MTPIKGGDIPIDIFAEVLRYVEINENEEKIVTDLPHKTIINTGSSGCYDLGIQYLEPKGFGFYGTITKWVVHVSMYDKVGAFKANIGELKHVVNASAFLNTIFAENFLIDEIEELTPENWRN